MSQRTYAVLHVKTGTLRCVDANNEHQARSFVAKDEYKVWIPSTAEAVEFGKVGGVIERAGKPEPTEATEEAA